MNPTTKFPRTNQELAGLGGGGATRFPASAEEYWTLAREAEYRVDFFNGEIIATLSYESEHSALDRLPDNGKWLESAYEQAGDAFPVGEQTMMARDIYSGTALLKQS